LLIDFEWGSALVRALRNRTMTQRCGKQPPDVLHQEEPGLKDFNKAEVLPQQSPTGILDCSSVPGSTERLAGRPTREYVNLTRLESSSLHDLFWSNDTDVSLEDLELRIKPPTSKVCTDCVAKRRFLLDRGENPEATCTFQAQVETHASGEE
jgi:hypothetical protein